VPKVDKKTLRPLLFNVQQEVVSRLTSSASSVEVLQLTLTSVLQQVCVALAPLTRV
jgi:hypothetical protein